MKNEANILKEKIRFLENHQIQELTLLKSQIQYTYEQIKTVNILKNAFKIIGSSPIIKENVLTLALGASTKFISKKIFLNLGKSKISQTIGTVIEYSIRNYLTNHAEKIKAVAEVLLYKMSKRAMKTNQEYYH